MYIISGVFKYLKCTFGPKICTLTTRTRTLGSTIASDLLALKEQYQFVGQADIVIGSDGHAV